MAGRWTEPPGGGFAWPRITPMAKRILLVTVTIHAVVFLLSLFGGERGLYDWFALNPARWKSPFPPVWQLLTYAFLHDVRGLTHVLFNALGLYFFGSMVEGAVGPRRFAVLYFSAVVVGGAAQLLLGLFTGGLIYGASAGVMGVVVAAATLSPDSRVIFIVFPMTLKVLALILVAIDVFALLGSIRGTPDNVARLAHLAGAAWGFVMIRRRWVWSDPLAAVEARVREQRDKSQARDEARVDELLAKIHREGIQSLTPRERAILKRASKR